MVNIMSLMEAVSTGRRYGYDSGDAYEFIGSIEESTAEFNYVLMTESIDLTSTLNTLDEIMVEAAVNGGRERVRMISEGVFANFAEKIKKFFKKLIELVKGIIAKLKEFFYTLTKNTNKWMSLMEAKVKEAANRSGVGSVTHEMYKWNIPFVTKGMSEGIVGLLKGTGDEVAKYFSDKYASTGIEEKYRDAGSVATTNNIDKESVKKITRMREHAKTDMVKIVAKHLGVSGGTMDAIWTGLAKKAKGGSEKVAVKFVTEGGLGVSNMLDAIRDSSDTINTLTDAYNTHLAELQEMSSNASEALDNAIDNVKNDDDEQKLRTQNAMRELYGFGQDQLTMLEGMCTTARGLNTEYVKAMTSDFMHALNKLAAYKEPKKN